MAQQVIINGQSGLICKNKLNENFEELYGGTAPIRHLFASQLSGINQDTSLTAGGGTDDTAVLQTALDGGNVCLVIDGPSLISAALFDATTHYPALQLYSNTTLLFLPGGGFFLSAHSNVPMVGCGQSLTTAVSNVSLIGVGAMAILNGNAANQDKESVRWWPYGVVFYNYTNVLMENIEVRNAKTFSIVFSAGLITIGKDFVVRNCRSYWTADLASMNKDGLHYYGTLDGGLVDGYYSNGNDDALALNFDEGVKGYTEGVVPTYIFGPASGGNLYNIIHRNVTIDPSNGAFAYQFTAWGGDGNPTGGNLVFENILANGASGRWNGDLEIDEILINGWIGGGGIPIANNGPAVSRLGLSNISPGTSVDAYADSAYGDFFANFTRLKSSNYTVDSDGGANSDSVLVATDALTFTLTQADVSKWRKLVFKNRTTASSVVVDATDLGQIFIATYVDTVTLTAGQSLTLISDGATWEAIGAVS